VGRPDTAKATLPVKPLWSTTLMVLLALTPPGSKVMEAREGERLKLGTGMVSAIVVLLVAVPDVPFTVTG